MKMRQEGGWFEMDADASIEHQKYDPDTDEHSFLIASECEFVMPTDCLVRLMISWLESECGPLTARQRDRLQHGLVAPKEPEK